MSRATSPPIRAPFHAAAGALLGFATSSGILGERLSYGDVRVAVLANLVATAATLLVLRWVERERDPGIRLLPLGFGVAFGIAAAHLAARAGVTFPAWMNEGPRQFVNDGVAVAALLALVWASARSRRPPVVVLGVLAALSVYRVTRALWHLDVAPRAFDVAVQDCVVAEVVAVAFALVLLRLVRDGMTD